MAKVIAENRADLSILALFLNDPVKAFGNRFPEP